MDRPTVGGPCLSPVGEIIAQAAESQISRTEMVEQLQNLNIPYFDPIQKSDSDWAKLRAAFLAGLLTDGEVLAIAEATARRMVARVNHSMDLEGQPVPESAPRRMFEEAVVRLLASLRD